MRTPALLLLVGLLFVSSGAGAAPIFVNEYNAVSAANFLDGAASTAADATLGRVQGNGGDWVELVVVQDHLDLRGGSLSIEEGNAVRTTTVLTFSYDSLWSDLRSGTIITVAEDIVDETAYDPFAGDWWINVQATTGGSGQFITASNFSVSNDNTQITVLDALAQVWFGPAGEGITPASGIGSDEVWKLEADPSAAITPASNYRDGVSSSFGAPNLWSSGTQSQSFTALRSSVVPEPGAATLVGVALAALVSARARRAA
jgi:hypothetical protein